MLSINIKSKQTAKKYSRDIENHIKNSYGKYFSNILIMTISPLISLALFNLANFFLYNLANSYLVNIMGKVLFGHYMLSLSILCGIGPILLFGNYFIITKELPIHISKKDTDRLKMFLNWSLGLLFKCFLVVTITAIALISAQLLNLMPCHHGICTKNSRFYIDAIYLFPVYIIIIWNITYLLAIKESTLGTVLAGNSTGIMTYIFAALVWLSSRSTNPLTYLQILAIFIISQLILITIQYAVIHLKRGKALSIKLFQCLKTPPFSLQEKSDLYKQGLSCTSYDALSSFVGISLVAAIEAAHPLKHTLSDYYICTLIASSMQIVSSTFQQNMWPYYSTAGLKGHSKNTKKLENLFKNYIVTGATWLAIIITIITLLQSKIYTIYATNNPQMTTGILINIIYQYISNAWTQSEIILSYHENMRAVYAGNIAQGTLQAVICYLLVPKIGFLGALIGQIIGSFVCATICFIQLKRTKLAIKPFGFL